MDCIIHLFVFPYSGDNIFHEGPKFTHFSGKVGHLTFYQALINFNKVPFTWVEV
jgi:hypothetical protein